MNPASSIYIYCAKTTAILDVSPGIHGCMHHKASCARYYFAPCVLLVIIWMCTVHVRGDLSLKTDFTLLGRVLSLQYRYRSEVYRYICLVYALIVLHVENFMVDLVLYMYIIRMYIYVYVCY